MASYLPLHSKDALVPNIPIATSFKASTSNSHATIAHMATTTLKVQGMTCGACTSSVESGFQNVEGVGAVLVSLVLERAVVQHDPATLSAEDIKNIIEDRGFDAEVLSTDMPSHGPSSEDANEDEGLTGQQLAVTTVSVDGMTCGACTSAVEGAFKDVPGVKSFSISLLSGRAVLEHEPSILSPERIAEIIEDSGFDAKVLDTKTADLAARRRSVTAGKQKRLLTTTVAIEGMTCGACTSAVEGGFKDVDGVTQFNISLLAERAIIIHDPAKIPTTQIVETIEDRGFDARVVSSEDVDSAATASSATVHLKIYGLSDAESASNLESHLRQLPGVSAVTVNISTTRGTITYRPSSIGLRAIVEAVEAIGYNALLADSDDNNAQLESLAKTKEIREWRRAFWTSLSFAIPVFLISMIIPMFLPFLNFGRIPLFIPGLWLGDLLCLLLTIPVQFGIGKRFYVSAFRSLKHRSPTMDVLVVLGTSAAFFFSVAAMLISILTPPHSRPSTVFDTSTMLITFVTLGRYLENNAKSETSKALSKLMSLAPSMATIYADPIAAAKAAERWNTSNEGCEKEKMEDSNGMSIEEKVVPTELIQVGDVVILKPGDKIPADGTVTTGESYVDESMVTGEAMPILKKKGSLLLAGTVNAAGRMDFRVTRAGRDTQLSQIVRLVQEAQTNRAPIQRMADRVAGYFVPIIITLGLSTFIGWMILSHVLPHPPKIFLDHESGGRFMVCLKLCISVIVFACPCALGLSTPTAVMVGTGVGAERGILVKGGAALETATKVTHVVLDKTGTLTMGKMSVANADIKIPTGQDQAAFKRLWWSLVGLAEAGSEHPIAKAIVQAAKSELRLGTDGTFDGSVGDFEASVGNGIAATVEPAVSSERLRYHVIIGNASFLRSKAIPTPASTAAEVTSPLSSTSHEKLLAGTTEVYVAIDDTYSGTISLSDTIKPSASALITALRLLNITPSLVTGDSLPAAVHVASLIGIPKSSIHAGVSPDQKREIIKDLQSRGHVVAMVGDGINDSPALATADVGIAMASGTDVAMEAADIVLMRPDDLLSIPASLHLAKAVFRRIQQNLIWACGYNVIGLPFAMGFFLPWGFHVHPMMAGAMMAASSVSVVISSLLLKTWKRPKWMSLEELEKEGARKPKGWRTRARDAIDARIGWARDIVRRRRRGDEARYVPLQDVEAV